MAIHIGRREFVATLGGAAAWPLAAHAQQPAKPVVGYLSPGFPAAHLLALLRQILAEAGYVEGRDLIIEYRYAERQYDRLPELAAELVQRQVAVIIAVTTPAALAAKAATATTPIVFSTPDDPVGVGLVAGLARHGGNATGVHQFNTALGEKQLGLLRELIPTAARVGLLVNPNNNNAEITKEVMAAASTIGVDIGVVRASDSREIEAAFATLVRNRADALIVGADSFFFGRRLQLATLATRRAIPAIYNAREYPEAGGLMSYGTSLTEVYRYLGGYTARILKGDKPTTLPVVQSTRFDLVINIPTARAIGLDVPPMLLAHADEVIE
jgi:putative tryptophan/tyrosine transport system substrate-binding protein